MFAGSNVGSKERKFVCCVIGIGTILISKKTNACIYVLDDVNSWAWDTHGSHEHWPHTNNNDFTLWAKHHIEIFSVDMMGSV